MAADARRLHQNRRKRNNTAKIFETLEKAFNLIGVAYQTAWSMCHKIRHAMSTRDEKYTLAGKVELDDAFFGSSTEGGKRGRGTEKTAVFTSVSLTDEGKPKFVKMKVTESVDSESAKKFVNDSIAKGSKITTDGLNVYTTLSENGYSLNQKIFDPKEPVINFL